MKVKWNSVNLLTILTLAGLVSGAVCRIHMVTGTAIPHHRVAVTDHEHTGHALMVDHPHTDADAARPVSAPADHDGEHPSVPDSAECCTPRLAAQRTSAFELRVPEVATPLAPALSTNPFVVFDHFGFAFVDRPPGPSPALTKNTVIRI